MGKTVVAKIILRSLVLVEKLSVEQREEDVGAHEEEELAVDELIEGTLPLEQKSGEAAGCGAGHISLVRYGHCVRVWF